VARPPIGAGECKPPTMRKASPSKQCEMKSKNNLSPRTATTSGQDVQAHADYSKGNINITSEIRPWGEANVGPAEGVHPPARPLQRPRPPPQGRPATGGPQPPHNWHTRIVWLSAAARRLHSLPSEVPPKSSQPCVPSAQCSHRQGQERMPVFRSTNLAPVRPPSPARDRSFHQMRQP